MNRLGQYTSSASSASFGSLAQHVPLLVTALVLALTTVVATNVIALPTTLVSSPIATVLLVIAALGAFTVDPAVGVSLLLLTAVLFFKRNVQFARDSASASTYGDVSIAQQPSATAHPATPGNNEGPRDYSQFAETDDTNPMLGPQKVTEGFEPAPYGEDSAAPADGQYPKDAERPMGSVEVRPFLYRPEADTGSNTFERYGPDLDEKKKVFQYGQV